MKTKATFLLLTVFSINSLLSQDTLSVLFLGNSYTSYNNLPALVQSLSTAAGKTLIIDSNMPGGFTISNHINDPTSTAKISQGNWDYIVIQEQSQLPTIDFYRYNDMYPALEELKFLTEQINPCTKLITYMTWGRRFGGQQCDPSNTYCSPVFTDFNHMQDSLTSAYTMISDMLGIQCAPVGVTWQNILNDTNLVLHSGDNSHPNLDGSYVAALSLFSSIWKIPSGGLAYNAGINPQRALYYQQQSDQTLFESSDDWNVFINNPTADFNYSASSNTFNFTSSSVSANNAPLSYVWNFGDGNSSTEANPQHTYATAGSYTVSLIVSDCIFSDTLALTIETGSTGIEKSNTPTVLTYPNPATEYLNIQTNAYQAGSNYLIYNNCGQIKLTGMLQPGNTQINCSGLSAGLYLIRIGEEFTRFVKTNNRYEF